MTDSKGVQYERSQRNHERESCVLRSREIPVVETEQSRKPIGVVTDRDIVCRTVAKGLNPLTLTAEDCMTMPCLFVGETESIEQCLEIMEENQIRRLVIVDENGSISGIVSQADIVRADPAYASEMVREISEPSSGESITLFP